MSKEYWWCVPCSEGDFYVDRRDCPFRDCSATYIPVVDPLDVPEPTTWDCPEVVTVEDPISMVYASPDVVIGERLGFITALRYANPRLSGMDVPTAINYVAGR